MRTPGFVRRLTRRESGRERRALEMLTNLLSELDDLSHTLGHPLKNPRPGDSTLRLPPRGVWNRAMDSSARHFNDVSERYREMVAREYPEVDTRRLRRP